jgi:hypothetical protein
MGWIRGALTAVPLVLLLSFSAAARGQDFNVASLSASQIFAKARHAEGRFASGTFHEVTQTTKSDAPGDVRLRDTYWNGDDYRTTVTRGGFWWSYGVVDATSWAKDENGFVAITKRLGEPDNPIAAALKQPDDRIHVLGLTGDGKRYALEVRLPDGLAQRRFYDAQTFLLDRIEETHYDGRHYSWDYGDYRNVGGRAVARSIDYRTDFSPAVYHTQVQSYESVPVQSGRFAMPQSTPLFGLNGRPSVTVPAEFTSDGIVVRLSVGGRGLDFLLDSGSSSIVIDPGIANELGLRLSGADRESWGGIFDVANTRATDVTIGSLHAPEVAMSAIAFQERLEHSRVVGLLGCDFIASGALGLDFQKETLTLYAAVPPEVTQTNSGWTAIPLDLSDFVPYVKAAFAGKNGRFIADLGAIRTVLYRHYFAQFHAKVVDKRDSEELSGIGGDSIGVKEFVMSRLKIGDLEFAEARVVVPSTRRFQDEGYDGLIGRDILSNFQIVFDYAHQTLYIKPTI